MGSGSFPELQIKDKANGWMVVGCNRERARDDGRGGRRDEGREGKMMQKRGRQHQDIQYVHGS